MEPAAPRAPLHWLFHIGHCGSTLVSRLLDLVPGILGLREPLPLLTLAHGRTDPAVAAWQPRVRALLARGFPDTAAVVVKPTSLVATIAHQLVPGAGRACLLWVDLETWLTTMLRDGALLAATLATEALRLPPDAAPAAANWPPGPSRRVCAGRGPNSPAAPPRSSKTVCNRSAERSGQERGHRIARAVRDGQHFVQQRTGDHQRGAGRRRLAMRAELGEAEFAAGVVAAVEVDRKREAPVGDVRRLVVAVRAEIAGVRRIGQQLERIAAVDGEVEHRAISGSARRIRRSCMRASSAGSRGGLSRRCLIDGSSCSVCVPPSSTSTRETSPPAQSSSRCRASARHRSGSNTSGICSTGAACRVCSAAKTGSGAGAATGCAQAIARQPALERRARHHCTRRRR